jgi:hypothetical protein
MPAAIHITGASGSSVSMLDRALAVRTCAAPRHTRFRPGAGTMLDLVRRVIEAHPQTAVAL